MFTFLSWSRRAGRQDIPVLFKELLWSKEAHLEGTGTPVWSQMIRCKTCRRNCKPTPPSSGTRRARDCRQSVLHGWIAALLDAGQGHPEQQCGPTSTWHTQVFLPETVGEETLCTQFHPDIGPQLVLSISPELEITASLNLNVRYCSTPQEKCSFTFRRGRDWETWGMKE